MELDFRFKENYTIYDLLNIMKILRSEQGCPWDREQTHATIRKNFIEETYEAVEAIDLGDTALLKEELGDVLLQVVFHTQIEDESGGFDFDGVCDGICKKLIVRHPHIFADVIADTSSEVLHNWEEIKKREKGQTTAIETLRSVPSVLPALMRSAKVQHRAAKTGFDYPDVHWAISHLESEIAELKQAVAESDREGCEEELGDVLFSAVNVSRFLKLDAEESLTRSCEKFIRRFEAVETLAQAQEMDMKTMPMEELDALWKEAKIMGYPDNRSV